MANNRIYLRCRHCGRTLFLGKSFGRGFGWFDYGRKGPLGDQLNDFYEEHCFCMADKVHTGDEAWLPLTDERNEGIFDIVYEDLPCK